METVYLTGILQNAENVPYVTADEAYSLMKTELERFIALIETLDPPEWALPTACTLWTVREIVAHQAGGYASGTGYREFLRQVSAPRKPGQLPEDAVNALQVGERAGRTPAELIAELRRVGPPAIHNWAYGFGFARLITIPHPVCGTLSVGHVMSVIHSRDTWMHRLDICRATGRKFEQTAGQDDRIAALVMPDVEKSLRRKLGKVSLAFDLTGPTGGAWKIGPGEPAARIQMDVLDFNIFASGRFSVDEARARASLSGDVALAEKALQNLLVVY